MSERQAAAAGGGAASAKTEFSCETYLFPGWKTSIAAILAGMAISFVLFGLFYPYWWFSDQDLILAYQGLLLNAGLPQEYFDHTGYLYDLAIAGWYSLLHWVGLLPVHSLAELPAKENVPAFNAAWQHLIVAGRLLSLLMAGFFVWLYATLVRRLVGDWKVAVLAAMALSVSGAVIMHMRQMRTELLSGGLAVIALLLILLAAQAARRPSSRPLLLALAALAATLAIVTKVQAVLLVATLPAIALAFGRRDSEDGQPDLSPRTAILWIVAALIAAVPATGLFLKGLADLSKSQFPYLHLGFIPDGAYQAGIALWVVAAMAVYGRLWKVSVRAWIAGMAAVLLGVSLGLLSLTIRFQEQNLLAVTHPIEHLYYFATWSAHALGAETQVLNGLLFQRLAAGIAGAVLVHDFEPVFLLEIFAIVGAIVAWRRGDRQLPLQVVALVVVAFCLDAVFKLRHTKVEYFIYTDPLLILAAALVAVRFPEWQHWAWKRKATLAVVAFCVLWGNHVPVRQFLFATHDPKLACQWMPHYLSRIGPFPYCLDAPSK